MGSEFNATASTPDVPDGQLLLYDRSAWDLLSEDSRYCYVCAATAQKTKTKIAFSLQNVAKVAP